jgi:hypothetical protein
MMKDSNRGTHCSHRGHQSNAVSYCKQSKEAYKSWPKHNKQLLLLGAWAMSAHSTPIHECQSNKQ